MNKPFYESCEENKQVILQQLQSLFKPVRQVLEIGSGSGQHAVFFSQQMAHLQWQPSDLQENLAGIELWRQQAGLSNIKAPIELDVMNLQAADLAAVDAVFTANTLHIMSIVHVEALFQAMGRWLQPGGLFCCYGPFNHNGQFSSDSNARFDQWLKQRDAVSGIRDLSELSKFAEQAGIGLKEDIEMPVNNRILIWSKH
ncbi:MAG: class I SAM-dependent methyltransferase [Gammaproteobacteria bacterium]|nr:class I SAM-dependent methyltransferase [Gammaproteobacteria bacterium]